jgi:hypothetical protein
MRRDRTPTVLRKLAMELQGRDISEQPLVQRRAA